MIDLFPWQVPHVQQLVTAIYHYGHALDASDTGTGKTICAIQTAKRLNLSVYVVTRKSIIPTWQYWLDELDMGEVRDHIINYEMARVRGVPNLDQTLYVFDEVHEAAGYATKNAHLLMGVVSMRRPVLLLSATAAHTPLKMYAIGYALGLHNGTNFWSWARENGCAPNPKIRGMWWFTNQAENMAKLHADIFPAVGSRMRKAEIPDFPEVTNIVQAYDLPAAQPGIAEYRNLISEAVQDELIDPDVEMDLDGGLARNQLVELLYDRMETELDKVSLLIELAHDALEEGMSVVIFTNFRLTAVALVDLGDFENAGVSLLMGGQEADERAVMIELFQCDVNRVMIATIQSGGIGISLHDLLGKFPRISFICPTFSAVHLRQAMGRIHRAGAKSKAINKLVYAAKSIEAKIARSVARKLQALDTLNDGDLTPGPQPGLRV